YLADPRRRERVEFAKALAAALAADAAAAAPAGRRAAVASRTQRLLAPAAMGLLAVAAGWAGLQGARLRGERSARQAQLAAVQARLREQNRDAAPRSSVIAALALAIPSTRTPASGPPPVLSLPPQAGDVRFDLAMDDSEYASYEVSVRHVPGT